MQLKLQFSCHQVNNNVCDGNWLLAALKYLPSLASTPNIRKLILTIAAYVEHFSFMIDFQSLIARILYNFSFELII